MAAEKDGKVIENFSIYNIKFLNIILYQHMHVCIFFLKGKEILVKSP